jgi:hypothetical protein
LCNNNRPKLTPEQKMVNAVFQKIVGEDVYKDIPEEVIQKRLRQAIGMEDDESSALLFTLDPDEQSEYILTVSRYMHFCVDALQEEASVYKSKDDYHRILYMLQIATKMMHRLVKGLASDQDMTLIDEWETQMESW